MPTRQPHRAHGPACAPPPWPAGAGHTRHGATGPARHHGRTAERVNVTHHSPGAMAASADSARRPASAPGPSTAQKGPTVSVCPACHRPREAGCDGVQVNADRYGQEAWWSEDWAVAEHLVPKPHCADCGTPSGAHHHANCLLAYCMVCGGQAVACEHARDNAEVIG